jgi:hypothetical protein
MLLIPLVLRQVSQCDELSILILIEEGGDSYRKRKYNH